VIEFEDRMALLRRRFVERAGEEARRVENHLAAGEWAELRSLCHGLAGRAGMFGLPELGAEALRLEELIEADATPDLIRALGYQLLQQLRAAAVAP
jgi:HPt (histidine-containing phosphotransfer) domain-containing protein